MKKVISMLIFISAIALLIAKSQSQTVTDYDGNVYHTVFIGSQVWLKENLKTTHYNNGVPIPNVPGGASWATLTTGARCYYNNDSSAYDSVYGALYNWYAVNDTNEICPSGWHVPTDAECTAIETFLGGSFFAGGPMKEAGTAHWSAPNTGATNSSGFTGLPGGMLGVNYTFQTINQNDLWWTSTQQSLGGAWSRYLWYLNAGVDRNPTPKTIALSIRCMRGIGVGLGDKNQKEKIKLYPNPSDGKITIDCGENKELNFLVYNLSGEIILQNVLTRGTNKIDISSLARGIYFIKITVDTWTVQQKLIKQ